MKCCIILLYQEALKMKNGTKALVALVLMSGICIAQQTENVVFGQYNISFNLDIKDPLTKALIKPIHNNGLTAYFCAFYPEKNPNYGGIVVTLASFDKDNAALGRNASDNAKMWLNGLTWKTTSNSTQWISLCWLNNRTELGFGGSPNMQREFDYIIKTLSVKQDGKEIYNVTDFRGPFAVSH